MCFFQDKRTVTYYLLVTDKSENIEIPVLSWSRPRTSPKPRAGTSNSEQGLLLHQLRRRLSVSIIRAQSSCLLSKIGHFIQAPKKQQSAESLLNKEKSSSVRIKELISKPTSAEEESTKLAFSGSKPHLN